MSRSIQEALELPALENLLKASAKETEEVNAEAEPEIEDHLVAQFSDALGSGATVKVDNDAAEADDHADSMDEIHDEVLQHAKDLMDLGYNVDTRSAGRIFENAAGMYKLALEAKNSKRKAQLDKIKAEQEQQKIDIADRRARGENADVPQGSNVIESGSVVIEDRNELIRRLRGDSQ